MKQENCLEIISSNGLLSIQDLGRKRSQHLGFSVGGCADEHAFLFANKLVSTQPKNAQKIVSIDELNQPTLEITMGQTSLRANKACTVAITGADCCATINHLPAKNWQLHHLNKNDTITFAMPKSGLHSYLAVNGGIKQHLHEQKWLGSYSQTLNEISLGYSGEVITQGSKIYSVIEKNTNTFDRVQKVALDISNRSTNQPDNFYAQQQLILRFIPNTLFKTLSTVQKQIFLEQVYQISPNSNRMGYRLLPCQQSDNAAKHILTDDIRCANALSAPVNFGMIQLPENEQPIILMKERQTIGGYPVLGNIIQTDLFRLCQMRAGEKVQFLPTTIEKAQQQLSTFYQRFTF